MIWTSTMLSLAAVLAAFGASGWWNELGRDAWARRRPRVGNRAAVMASHRQRFDAERSA